MSITIRCPHCEVKLLVESDMLGEKVECEDCGKRFVAEPISNTQTKRESNRQSNSSTSSTRTTNRSRRSQTTDDDDHRPTRRRRKPVKSSTSVAPIIFGSLLILMLIGVSIGFYWMFGFGSSSAPVANAIPLNQNVPPNFNPPPVRNPANAVGNFPPPVMVPKIKVPAPAMPPPAADVKKFTLSNPRWGRGDGLPGGMPGEFSVDYNYLAGGRPGFNFRLVWKYDDGIIGSSDLRFLTGTAGTLTIRVVGALGRPNIGMTMWVEEGGRSTPFQNTPGTKVSNDVPLN